jgi:FkbM family methyltransferase
MISYAQNAEDILLLRILGARPEGYYIDVGACWPEDGSVTKLFYDQGWRGINIEPHPEAFALLSQSRPRDINLNIAVSDIPGRRSLVHGPSTGESCLDGPTGGKRTEVDTWTLRDICDRYVTTDIDFLKIDVEGQELAVLRGCDLKNYRPKIILLETTKPWSNVKRADAHDIFSLLKDQRYQHTYFDGLNDYFIADEARLTGKNRWFQPNPIDQYVTAQQASTSAQLSTSREEIEHSAQRITHLISTSNAKQAELEQLLVKAKSEKATLANELAETIQTSKTRESDSFSHITALTNEIVQYKQSQEHLISTSNARQAELEQLLARAENEIAILGTQLVEALNTSQTRECNFLAQINTLTSELTHNKKSLSALIDTSSNRELQLKEKVTNANTRIKNFEDKITQLNENIASAEEVIANLETQLAIKESEQVELLTNATQEATKLKQVIYEQAVWGEAAVRHVSQLNTEISSIRNSFSWKLTAPTRSAFRILRRYMHSVSRKRARIATLLARLMEREQVMPPPNVAQSDSENSPSPTPPPAGNGIDTEPKAPSTEAIILHAVSKRPQARRIHE